MTAVASRAPTASARARGLAGRGARAATQEERNRTPTRAVPSRKRLQPLSRLVFRAHRSSTLVEGPDSGKFRTPACHKSQSVTTPALSAAKMTAAIQKLPEARVSIGGCLPEFVK